MHDATTIEVGCLRSGPQSTQDLAWKLGMSPTAVTSLLSMLAVEGKVHITGAELAK